MTVCVHGDGLHPPATCPRDAQTQEVAVVSLSRRVYLLESRIRARRATVQDAEPGRRVLDGESAQAVLSWHREHGDPAQIGDGDGLAVVQIAQEAT